MAKLYTVVKNGEELETLKTLAAAKKLADAEQAEVLCDGEKVYEGVAAAAEKSVVIEGRGTITAEPVVAKKHVQPDAPSTPTERYRLKALMNERCRPDIKAAIRQVRAEGTVVRVKMVSNDWLHLADGGYILYEGGKWAEKV